MDNSNRRIDRVRLGAVAAVDTTTNGTLYFDAFESRRSTYIGPMASPVVTTTITYVYDPLYRLKEANYSDGRYFRYTYDAVGNRLTEEKCAVLPCGTPITNTYTYDSANRLTSVNGQTYQWDNNGNLLNDGTSTYVYDAANRLTSVVGGGNTSTYTYNGLGDRLSQTVDSVTTNYVLDLNAGLTQVLADGTNTYLYGNGRIGELQPGGFAYHLGDALGSVRQLTDASGGVTLARNFEPYGTTLSSAGTGATTFAFTGEQFDASTGLSYNRARYYASVIGRFFQKDPSQTERNVYLYANSNPVMFTDPSGLCKYRIGDPPNTCRVEPGEWLHKIARDYNIDPQQLAAWNGNRNIIHAGDLIYLYDPNTVSATATPTSTPASDEDSSTSVSVAMQCDSPGAPWCGPDGALWGWSADATMLGIGPFRFTRFEEESWEHQLACDNWYSTVGVGEETVVDLVHEETAVFTVQFMLWTATDLGSLDLGAYTGTAYGFSKPKHSLLDYAGFSVCYSFSPGGTVGLGGSVTVSMCGPKDTSKPAIGTRIQQFQVSAGFSADFATRQVSLYTFKEGPRPSTPDELAWAEFLLGPDAASLWKHQDG